MDPLDSHPHIPQKDPSKKESPGASRTPTPPLFDPTKEVPPLDPKRITPPEAASAAVQKNSSPDKNTLDIKISHALLASIISKLGFINRFFQRSPDEGICFGCAHMGIQAFLLKDMQAFDERLKKLDALKTDDIDSLVETIKKDPDLLAFFEGMLLYNEGYFYTELYEKDLLSFNAANKTFIPTISQLLLPEKLQVKGGLATLVRESGLYTVDTLTKYLDSIKMLSQTDAPPLALQLLNQSHALSIGYDPDINRWTLIEAGTLEKRRVDTTAELAQFIISIFRNQKETPILTTMYATKEESKEPLFQKRFTEWKTSQDTTRKNMLKAASLKKISLRGKKQWLYAACRMGDLAVIKALLQSGIDPNVESSIGQTSTTPLLIAITTRESPTVEYLLTHGANPNHFSASCPPPLCQAAHYGDVASCKLLLDHGADANMVASTTEQSPLFYALVHNNPLLIELLLKKKANVNNRCHDISALMYALLVKTAPEVIYLLIEHGADVNAMGGEDTILDIARQIGSSREVIDVLIAAGGKSAR